MLGNAWLEKLGKVTLSRVVGGALCLALLLRSAIAYFAAASRRPVAAPDDCERLAFGFGQLCIVPSKSTLFSATLK